MGISSLMGYQEGGGVNTSTQSNNQELGTEGLGSLTLQVTPPRVDIGKKSEEYRNLLSSVIRPPSKPSFYDLASQLGAALLAQQSKEKIPSIGRGLGIGFQSFKQELDAKNKALEENLDKIALQSVTMALDDSRKAEQSYNDLLYKQLLSSIDPDRGTVQTYGKQLDDGTMSYQTFGNKEIDKIAKATGDGYTLMEKPMVQIGGAATGLEEVYKGIGRSISKSEENYGQDYELAQKSNQLLDQMERYGNALPDEAFGLTPQLTEPIRRLVVSFPGIKDLPIADGLNEIQSKAEPMASVTVNLAMMNVQKTKGPISDTEMKLFIRSIPSIAQTKEGYFNTIKIMREINDFIVRFETERLSERDKYLQQSNASVTGLAAHMSRWETDWRNKNRAFSDEQVEEFRDKALETDANDSRRKIADEAIAYFDTMSKPQDTTASRTSDLSDDELQKLLNELDQ